MILTYDTPKGARSLELQTSPATLLKEVERAVRDDYQTQIGQPAPAQIRVTFGARTHAQN